MRRTLNIGLGGTGIKSILNLRKTLYASGKDPKAVRDKIRFLVIDSHEEDIVKINNREGDVKPCAIVCYQFGIGCLSPCVGTLTSS